jgi:hypothetical protein
MSVTGVPCGSSRCAATDARWRHHHNVSKHLTRSSPGFMTGLEPHIPIAERYRRFARLEAAGRSSTYEQLANVVAQDAVIVSFLEQLPPLKRQPNLLFGAARYLLGTYPDPDSLHELVATSAGELVAVMSSRRTQTNEAARCAVLLPALAALPQPLALIEVGAAAGLTLLPDFYSYDYDGRQVTGLDPQAPVISCRAIGPVPVPDTVPEVAWRAGLDLNPLDARSPDDLEWLSCLIWPGEERRTERLLAAAEVARRHPVTVHQGDLVDQLPSIAAQAPTGATLVIYHTAVLAYVDQAKRDAFASLVSELGAIWLSNESNGVVRDVRLDEPRGGFLLIRGGNTLLARTDPHGTWLEWSTRPADD